MKTTEKTRELTKQFIDNQISENEYQEGMLHLIEKGYLQDIGLELVQAQFDQIRQQQQQTATQL